MYFSWFGPLLVIGGVTVPGLSLQSLVLPPFRWVVVAASVLASGVIDRRRIEAARSTILGTLDRARVK